MRVPIYTADLNDKRGFNRIAKKLQQNWPSVTPLSLASAQGILSRGLGYRDFHDLQQSASEGDLLATLTKQNEARGGISTSIFAYCQSSKITSINRSDLDRLVKLLPLQELRVFQGSDSGQPTAPSAPTVLDLPLGAPRELPVPSDETSANHVVQPTDGSSKRRYSVPPVNLISEKGLRFIWEVVQRRGDLRDQSLIALLLQGLNPHDLRLAKPLDFSDFNSKVLMRVRSARYPSIPVAVLLSDSFGHVIGRYIQEAGLLVNGYLFPSKDDATVPMNSHEMNKMIGSYLRDALIDPEQRSAHRIRQSVITNAMKRMAISVSDMVGHYSPTTTLDYVPDVKKEPKT